jgi:predicted regulator of Ras-like GTPase activity (Roadblock/LC7/MglB family)
MAAVTLLPASLQNAMQEIVERTSQSGAGIRAILLSTTEGVPLGRVYAGDEPLNEEVLATLESVWAPASKQIPALGMEKVHQVTAIYDHGTLIHVYQAPVVCVNSSWGNKRRVPISVSKSSGCICSAYNRANVHRFVSLLYRL